MMAVETVNGTRRKASKDAFRALVEGLAVCEPHLQGLKWACRYLEESYELELEYKGVKTRVDEYEDGVLVEKKFVNFIPRTREELAKYYSHYVKQVEYEALFLTANGREVRKAFLLFVKRGEPEEGLPPLIAFEVPIDLNAITARFEEELVKLKDVLASGVPPEISKDYGPFDYPCTYCKYRPRCYGT